jgi:trans-2,3-dihydro-3-hydroxyanthranilate isomerase
VPQSRLELSWLDVFTDRALGGNPLAVVLDADELTAEQMQALAGELGLSETIFVLEDAARLRIFTPAIEMPLAGHPVVGASLELARRGRIPTEGRTVFRTGVGETPVDISGGIATMTQAAPERAEVTLDAAGLLGLSPSDVLGEPAACSTGVRFLLAQVRDRATLARVEADQAGIGGMDDPALGMVAWCEHAKTGTDPSFAMRMFAPRMGIAEDPATGVAGGALGALRVFEGAEPGRITISQGKEIGRPSAIHVEVGGLPGEPADVRVGGRAVLLFEGALAPGVLG